MAPALETRWDGRRFIIKTKHRSPRGVTRGYRFDPAKLEDLLRFFLIAGKVAGSNSSNRKSRPAICRAALPKRVYLFMDLIQFNQTLRKPFP